MIKSAPCVYRSYLIGGFYMKKIIVLVSILFVGVVGAADVPAADQLQIKVALLLTDGDSYHHDVRPDLFFPLARLRVAASAADIAFLSNQAAVAADPEGALKALDACHFYLIQDGVGYLIRPIQEGDGSFKEWRPTESAPMEVGGEKKSRLSVFWHTGLNKLCFFRAETAPFVGHDGGHLGAWPGAVLDGDGTAFLGTSAVAEHPVGVLLVRPENELAPVPNGVKTIGVARGLIVQGAGAGVA